MINIKCSCGEVYHADERFVGQNIKCRHCQSVLKIALPESEKNETFVSEESTNTESKQGNNTVVNKYFSPKFIVFDIICIVFAIIIVIYFINQNKHSPSTLLPSDKPAIANEPINNNIPNTNNNVKPIVEPVKPVSQYKGNQLQNGSAPLNNCFNNVEYGGNATLTIKNGGSTDAIICLFNIGKDRTIRNAYIQKNTDYTITNISQGNYKIRVFYGNDWNPNLINSCETKGNFETDVNFSEFDSPHFFRDDGNGYSTVVVTLYTVADGNASSSKINQNTFFGK